MRINFLQPYAHCTGIKIPTHVQQASHPMQSNVLDSTASSRDQAKCSK
jgi:hypothetical protein